MAVVFNKLAQSLVWLRLYYARGYSRDDAKEDFIDEIEELIEKAPDEATRKKFERMLSEMR